VKWYNTIADFFLDIWPQVNLQKEADEEVRKYAIKKVSRLITGRNEALSTRRRHCIEIYGTEEK